MISKNNQPNRVITVEGIEEQKENEKFLIRLAIQRKILKSIIEHTQNNEYELLNSATFLKNDKQS